MDNEKPALVTKGNKLIEARYKLPLLEQRVIYALLSRIKPDDKELPKYSFSINELAEFLGIKNNMYRDLKEIIRSLRGRTLIIKEPDRDVITGWVQKAILYKSGVVEFELDNELKPYLLELKGVFTSLKLSELMSFKSQYSGRLYELLSQYKKVGIRKIAVDEFKEMLGLDKKEYGFFGHIKARIINPAIEEINEKTALKVAWQPEKTGRKVTALVFKIDSKNTANKVPGEQSLPFDIRQVQMETAAVRESFVLDHMTNSFKIDCDTALDLIDQYSEFFCKAQLEYIETRKKPPINPKAYFLQALKENYAGAKRAKINCPKCNGTGKVTYSIPNVPDFEPKTVTCDCLY